jgi:hypothetical protein
MLDESAGCLILLAHQSQVKRSTVSHLVIGVIKTTGKENMDARFDFGVLLANTKLGQCSYSSSAYNGVLQYDTVVNITNILSGVGSLGALGTKQVEDSDRELGEFTVLNKLAQVGKS